VVDLCGHLLDIAEEFTEQTLLGAIRVEDLGALWANENLNTCNTLLVELSSELRRRILVVHDAHEVVARVAFEWLI
jgi:hypothetical protein